MNDPIIVVGAGPVGLTVAGELARRGVPVRIFDRLAEPTTESRAILVYARSLRLGLGPTRPEPFQRNAFSAGSTGTPGPPRPRTGECPQGSDSPPSRTRSC